MSNSNRLPRHLVAADDAGDLLALLGVEEPADDPDGRRGHLPHAVEGEAGRARDAALGGHQAAAHEREAEAEAVLVGVVERAHVEGHPLAVALDDDRHRLGRAAAVDLRVADAVQAAERAGEPLRLRVRIPGAAGHAVDGDHLVARSGDAPPPGSPPRSGRPTAGRLLEREPQGEQDHEGDHEVHERARGDHHDPLPHGLVAVGARGDLGIELLLRVHARDPHVAAERDRADPVLGLAALDAPELRREEEEEALDPHPDRLRGGEVARLVEDDQHGEAEEGEDPAHAATRSAISSRGELAGPRGRTRTAARSGRAARCRCARGPRRSRRRSR